MKTTMSFGESIFKSIMGFLIFIFVLGVIAFYPVTVWGIDWVWAAVTTVMGILTLWLFYNLVDWLNAVIQSWVVGRDLGFRRFITAFAFIGAICLGFGGLTSLAGMAAFGKMTYTGVTTFTVLFLCFLVGTAVVGLMVLFSMIDWPNDALDAWVAAKSVPPERDQIEVIKAGKWLADQKAAEARATLAQLRAKQERLLLGEADDDFGDMEEVPLL